LPTRNHLLAALPTPAFDALSVDLTPRSLDPGHVLLSTDERSGTIWFPLSGAVSLTPETREGEVAQAAVVGREGLVELSTAFGEATAAPWRAFVVLPGAALTIDAERFRGHLLGQRSLLAATHAYAARVIAVLAQGAVCSRFHSVRERAARWLLVLHDRADADAFPITQQMLADMIGAHRPTLSLVIQAFAAEALIRHARGTVAVANRSGLEAAACECYARVDAAPGRRSGGAAPPGTFDASFRRP
jgi:CRP-like cAMP-binding protein